MNSYIFNFCHSNNIYLFYALFFFFIFYLENEKLHNIISSLKPMINIVEPIIYSTPIMKEYTGCFPSLTSTSTSNFS